jgi:hypothetical protein
MSHSKCLCLTIVLLVCIPLSVWATEDSCLFKVEFRNPTDKMVTYVFEWISHPYKRSVPINIAGGELQPGKSRQLISDYLCGRYQIIWEYNDKEHWHAFSQQPQMDRLRILTVPDSLVSDN